MSMRNRETKRINLDGFPGIFVSRLGDLRNLELSNPLFFPTLRSLLVSLFSFLGRFVSRLKKGWYSIDWEISYTRRRMLARFATCCGITDH